MTDVKTSYLNASDIENFLNISNFETVRSEKKILLPFKISYLSPDLFLLLPKLIFR